MACGGLNDNVIDDVTWLWKVKVVIVFKAHYFANGSRQRLGYIGAPIVNGMRGIEWSRNRWRHVTQKGQSRDLVIFRCKYLKNGLR